MRVCFESVEGMDRELARLARGAGRLRYALGAGLETLARTGGHHELGFSSVEAYALERCERRARWTQQSRGLARRLSVLPLVRRALGTGAVGFSMAQVLARIAQPDDEAAWLVEACTRTVRQMQKLVERRRRSEGAPGAGVVAASSGPEQLGNDGSANDTRGSGNDGSASDRGGSGHDGSANDTLESGNDGSASDRGGSGHDGSDAGCAIEGGELRTLTVTVDQEDAWLLECARMIVGHVAGPTTEDTVEALLGEGTTSLLEVVSANAPDTPGGADFRLLEDEPDDARQREWEAQLSRWRDQAEERCEAQLLRRWQEEATAMDSEPTFDGDATAIDREPALDGDTTAIDREPALDGDATAIDCELRRLAGELAVRDLEIGRLAEAFWKADGWRRLGHATDAQYARERLGTSLSSIKTKRTLARRVAGLPELDAAIRGRTLGYEAACLVAGIATPDTVEAWIERARERTVKHLREEVRAAELLARLDATARPRTLTPSARASAASAASTRTPAMLASERRGSAASAASAASTRSAAPGALWPPSEEILQEIAALESHIVSGEVFRNAVDAPDGREGAPLHRGRATLKELDSVAGQATPAGPGRNTAESHGSGRQMSASQETPERSASLAAHAAFASPGGQKFAPPDGRVVPGGREPALSGAAATCLGQLSNAIAGLLERLGSSADPGGPRAASLPSRRDRARGRVTLRLRVSAGTRRYYRWLERLFERRGPRGDSFLRFLCASLVEAWKSSLGEEGAYAVVRARDGHRCTSPVCTRRDVTPHHLRFRSAGGDDSLENLTSLCVWCHLEGVHGGRLRAAPPAGHVTWSLGRRGHEHTVVHGRRRRRGAVPGGRALAA